MGKSGATVMLGIGILLLLSDCAESDSHHRPVVIPTDSGRPATSDASKDRDAASDVDASVHNWTMIGSYRCCLPGEGTTCCEGVHNNLCYGYGGFRGQCIAEGGGFDGKDSCALCCPGLIRGNIACVDSPDFVASGFVCILCGDGVCGAAEDECNCPADCPAPGHSDASLGDAAL